jgi:hypothetical protein
MQLHIANTDHVFVLFDEVIILIIHRLIGEERLFPGAFLHIVIALAVFFQKGDGNFRPAGIIAVIVKREFLLRDKQLVPAVVFKQGLNIIPGYIQVVPTLFVFISLQFKENLFIIKPGQVHILKIAGLFGNLGQRSLLFWRIQTVPWHSSPGL